MNSVYAAPAYAGSTRDFETVETLLDDVSRQMASSNLTRYSRGTAGQRSSGGSMRIVKPNSTSNSPRGSIGLSRRRTVMADRGRIALGAQNMANAAGFVTKDCLQVPTRSNRPVSWHPSSQMPPSQYHSTYQIPNFHTQPDNQPYDFPPTPAMYSGYCSPDSPFSPLPIPYSGYEQNYPHQSDNTAPYQSSQDYRFNQYATPSATAYHSTAGETINSTMHPQHNWSQFSANGFENGTSPPTPEFYLPIEHPETTLPVDDVIPYHSLSDSEPEGEILQGLGLYDAPELSKSLSTGNFDDFRVLAMPQLLGTTCRRSELESTGKGLKLEETWNPPPSDDEDDDDEDDDDDEEDDDDDDEQDGEGEDEEPVNHSTLNHDYTERSNALMDTASIVPNAMQDNQGWHSSWL